MAEWRPVATYSIVACDLEAGQWGVATQSKFLAVGSVVPWAEPHVGAIATQSYANPSYGPDGLRLLRDGLSAEDGRRPADRGGRRPRAAPARHRRRPGRRGHASPARAATPGRAAAPGPATPRRATSSSRARRSTRSPRRSRRPPGPLAERLLDCLDAAAGRGRRPSRPAVRGAPRRRAGRRLRRPLRHARRPARRRPPAPDRGAAAPLRHPPGALRPDAARRSGSTSTRSSPPSCASGSPRLGYEGELADAFTALVRKREPGGAGRRHRAHRPGRARGAEGGEMSEGYEVAHLDELEALPVNQGEFVWRPVRRRFGISAFGTNAYTARAGQRVVEEHSRAATATRRCTSCCAAVRRSRSATTRSTRPAGTLVFARPGNEARRDRRRGRHGGARRRREARRRLRALAVGGHLRGLLLRREAARSTAARELIDRRRRAPPGRVARAVQRGVLRDPLRRHGGRDRAPPAGVRARPRAGRGGRPKDRDFDAVRDDPRVSAIAGQANAAGAARAAPGTGSKLGPRDDEHGAPARPRRARRRASARPTASANALWARSPPKGTSSSGAASPAEHVAVGDATHRHVGDERRSVRARDADRDRVRPGERRSALRARRAGPGSSPSAPRRGRPRRAAAPSSRARRSGSSARRRRPAPARGGSASCASQIAASVR